MTMQVEVKQRLDVAAGEDTPATLIVNHDRDQVEIALLGIDSIGCAFDYLSYRTPRLEQLDSTQLKELGEQLAKRVTYLLEQIRPIEIDGQAATLQLRSQRPQQHQNGKRYYEVLAQPGSILLCRYEKSPAASRKRVPANVTREVMIQLVSDFEAAGLQ